MIFDAVCRCRLKSGFVQQAGTDGVRCVHNPRYTKGLLNVSPTVGTLAPLQLADSEPLGHLLVDEVAKDRELAGETMIDAHYFFLQVCRRVVTADEGGLPARIHTVFGRGENACGQQRCGVGRDSGRKEIVLFGKGASLKRCRQEERRRGQFRPRNRGRTRRTHWGR